MKKIPLELKKKLEEIQKCATKVKQLSYEIADILEEYDLDINIFTATADLGIEEQTEAFTNMTYGEGTVKENIKEFEHVFLHHINKK
ncbi:MAG: hypothetical protein KH415_22755 [Clostridium sp.]|nr:hypothetical protein [Clostridium sp.]